MGKNIKKTLALLLALFLVLPAVAGCSSAWEVPNLAGTKFFGEEELYAEYPDLPRVAVEYAYHHTVPKGTIIFQSPGAGASKAESLLITVSLGGAPVSVSLQGDFRLARAALEERMESHYGKGNWGIQWKITYNLKGASGEILSWQNAETKNQMISAYCTLEAEVGVDLSALDDMVGYPMQPIRELLTLAGISVLVQGEDASVAKGALTRVLYAENGVVLYYQE